MPKKAKENEIDNNKVDLPKQIEELTKKNTELSAENNKLKEENNQLKEDNNKYIEKVKIAQAETINYRKRKDEEVTNMLKYANEDIIKELIELTDNFERAIKLDDDEISEELKNFLSGFKIMYSNLTLILKKYGVEEINRVGELFDPNQEEALLTASVEGKANEEVLEVLLKGYKLKDKVIRPASVKVNIGQ